MIRKITGIAIAFMAIITQAGAQGLSIELDGGLQGTRYSLQNGQSQLQAGGSLGLGYGFRLGRSLNLLTGVTGGVYRTQASLRDGVVFSSYQVDDAGSAFQYTVKPTGYKETQQFFAASVPLLLQYHTTDAGVQWYFAGGGKVFVPFNTSTQVSATQLSLSGYYPDFNVDLSNLPQHGFGTINNWKANATTKLRPAAALSAATGLSFSLSPGTRFYAGVYVDFGLTDLKETNDSIPLATYSSTGISGVQAGGVLNMPKAGQVRLLSFGLQLRLSFGSGGSKAAARHHKITEPEQPAKDTIGDEQYEGIEGAVVFGYPGETAIPENQKNHLDEVAAIMKQYPAIQISIAGHICDDEKGAEDNKVGAERAKAVAQYLRSKGVDPSRMHVSSVGESDVFEPFNPLANFRSRRAVITVLNKK
jgi:OOP family OmpA-OmpF porin